MWAERTRSADRQSDRISAFRHNLMQSAAWPRSLAIGMLTLGLGVPGVVGVSLMTAGGALAANECGAIPAGPNSTVNCVGLVIGNGIEYGPNSTHSVFTLNVGNGTPGGATAVTAPSLAPGFPFFGAGQYGVVIGAGFVANIPTSGANSSVVLNINEHSQVQGTAGGAFVWTTGAGHHATINNYGSVLTQGTGTGSLGIGLNAVSNNANADVTNYSSGVVSSLNNGLNAFSLSGGSTVTLQNDGRVTSQNRDGMSSFDPATGLIPTFGTAQATNNGTINAGRHGINLGAVGDATVNLGATSVINAGAATNGAGVSAISATGNVVIAGNARSETNSASGPGIVGISLLGTSTVDAGVVNSGSGNASIGGFAIPAIPGLPSISGGVLSLASGDAVANAHGDITTTGNFGVLALSLNGNATASSAAGITIDPPIGMAAVTLGSGLASVQNNATIMSTQVGLLGVNLGDGAVRIDNSATGDVQATSGAGIVAVKIGPNDNPVPLGTDAVVVNNRGTVDAPNGAGVFVLALDPAFNTPNNVLVTNDLNASITGAGGLLDPAIGVLADGNVRIINDHRSQIDTAAGLSGVALGVIAGGNVNVTNDRGSDVLGLAELVSLTGSTTFNNDRGATWNSSGINVFAAAVDTTINNDRDAEINMVDIGGANIMIAGRDATINNDRGADIRLLGINGNFMIAHRDATINNDRGADITLAGINGNFMFAGEDATINNSRGASLNLLGVNGNFMGAGGDATINNASGGTINLIGINTLGFVAGGDTTVNNSSVVNVAGFASFLGLDNFNNSVAAVGGGLLDMRNGISDYGLLTIPVYNSGIGDVTFVSGSFNGGYDSELGVDSYLGGVLDSSSDLLIAKRINHGMGPAYADGGPTAVLVNDTNPGPGAYNPIGIPVIGVLKGETQLGDFYLANGPINKGLFTYDLFLDSPGAQAAQWTPHFFDDADAWVLASYLDNYSIPQTMSIAQGMWHTTADSWIDRASDLRTLYGSNGGSGADLTYEPPAPVATVPTHHSGNTGIWGRVIGQMANRDVSYTTEPFHKQAVTVDGDYEEHLGAIQGGIDHAFQHGTGTTVIGLLAGYAHNSVDFIDAGDTAKITAPHIGAYLNWLSGGTYVDALIKADFLNADLDVAGEEVSTKGHSLGGRLEVGHRHQTGQFFIEPVGAIAYVQTQIDSVTVNGIDITLEDAQSLRGKIGGRIGFSSNNGGAKFDPYLHAYVGNEFLGENTAFFASGPGLTVVDDVSGIFGEVGGGFNLTHADRSGAIYGQANYIFADGYHAGNAKLGARVNW